MTARGDAGAIRTIFIDADGRPTDDPSRAVRGEVVEVAPDGSIVADYPSLAWSVDPGSLQGNEGELATRPRRAAAGRAATVTRRNPWGPARTLVEAEPPRRQQHSRKLQASTNHRGRTARSVSGRSGASSISRDATT